MVGAMRDSRLGSADFIHSLLGFTAGALQPPPFWILPGAAAKIFKC